jgi:hypothetical protein
MYKICLTGFAHCAIVVKQLCWNRTNWKRVGMTGKSLLVLVKILLDFSAITLIAKHIRQNSSLQEGQSLYLTGLFSNPETADFLQNQVPSHQRF